MASDNESGTTDPNPNYRKESEKNKSRNQSNVVTFLDMVLREHNASDSFPTKIEEGMAPTKTNHNNKGKARAHRPPSPPLDTTSTSASTSTHNNANSNVSTSNMTNTQPTRVERVVGATTATDTTRSQTTNSDKSSRRKSTTQTCANSNPLAGQIPATSRVSSKATRGPVMTSGTDDQKQNALIRPASSNEGQISVMPPSATAPTQTATNPQAQAKARVKFAVPTAPASTVAPTASGSSSLAVPSLASTTRPMNAPLRSRHVNGGQPINTARPSNDYPFQQPTGPLGSTLPANSLIVAETPNFGVAFIHSESLRPILPPIPRSRRLRRQYAMKDITSLDELHRVRWLERQDREVKKMKRFKKYNAMVFRSDEAGTERERDENLEFAKKVTGKGKTQYKAAREEIAETSTVGNDKNEVPVEVASASSSTLSEGQTSERTQRNATPPLVETASLVHGRDSTQLASTESSDEGNETQHSSDTPSGRQEEEQSRASPDEGNSPNSRGVKRVREEEDEVEPIPTQDDDERRPTKRVRTSPSP
ncbi:hypothetical protein BDN72DRAFT_856630 [Pluteus cervinus]|uniref:Uncharacterized protein n=1 Tax=Pluteus cervinus TaxID=181527 RepID=A0ACD3AYS3_9AGAR|nr:hypothetical protein BDN72DRAFT_856630 [Pluteus cervinus]